MILIVTISIIMTLAAAADDRQETPVIRCGRQLANTRVLLCYGAEYLVKRTSDNLYDSLDEADWEYGLWGKRGDVSARWPPHKRIGLADECCLKPCTTDVILKYC